MKKCAVTMGTQHQSYEKEFAVMREMGVEPHWYETEIDGSMDPEVVIRYCKGYDYVTLTAKSGIGRYSRR